ALLVGHERRPAPVDVPQAIPWRGSHRLEEPAAVEVPVSGLAPHEGAVDEEEGHHEGASGSVAVELDEPRVADPEVVGDLVADDAADLSAEFLLVAACQPFDRAAGDGGLVRGPRPVPAAPARGRYALGQP